MSSFHFDTELIHFPDRPPAEVETLSTPIHQASTILFRDLDEYDERNPLEEAHYIYGLSHTPTTLRLSRAIAHLEHGYNSVLTPSGLAAISVALLANLNAGDHLLIPQNAYAPLRLLAEDLLQRMQISHTIYDATAEIETLAPLIRNNTRVIWVETPGSITFEVADLPAIAALAHANNAQVIVDNTWSAGRYLNAFDKGADYSVQALTKYPGGHSDVLLGAVTARDEAGWVRLKRCVMALGIGVGPQDCFLTLRGLQTMALRMDHCSKVALQLARWLETQAPVLRVLHPALPSCPGHEIWRRDFTGCAGLFSILLKPQYDGIAVQRLFSALRLFKIGVSWGGTTSLALAYRGMRHAYSEGGTVVRFSIGLEHEDDLRADLAGGLLALDEVAAA